jgi:FKBP-type peptidyl-prolyl cis-trans isomerase SlyD
VTELGGVAVQRVGPEVLVQLEYSLFDAEGELVEAPGADETIEFIFGVGQAPAVFEQAVDGLALGDSRRVELGPNEAFGPRDDEAIVVVHRSELPAEVALGDELEAESEDGELIFLRVVELEDDIARLDANHPLAGQRVALELRVVGMRAATSAEVVAANAELDQQAEQAPDVLVSRLLRRERFTPPQSE